MSSTSEPVEQSAEPASELIVALIGNPNTGKSTIFSDLVGVRQRVGNYPGVTVEKKTGEMEHDGHRYELVDLPGLYSLAPRSRDEMVAVDLLLGSQAGAGRVDAVICIVDASNLERNLYLVSQVLELDLPTVLALNLVDVAKDHGLSLDIEQLERELGIPVVATQANRRIGIDELKAALARVIVRPVESRPAPFPEPFEQQVDRLEEFLADRSGSVDGGRPLPRWLVERLLLDVDGYLQGILFPQDSEDIGRKLQTARSELAESGHSVPGVETSARYGWARKILGGVLTEPNRYKPTPSDLIDRVLTHRVWGMLIFAALMAMVFQFVFVWAQPFMDGIDWMMSSVGGWIEGAMNEGALRSLLVDGVVGGVGGVLVFLPQILILFFFIAVMEDCGYMARGAYLMDRLMARVGLSGKSFIPMLSSFACAVPGIMATRVIGDERNRLTTILVAPLMTCSARFPVYALLIAAFIPRRSYLGGLVNLQGITLAALYLLGIVTAIVAALVLKKTLLRGKRSLFLMELPTFRRPSARTVFHRVWERGWMFIRCAGTMILAVSILVWAALYYPHNSEEVEGPYRARQQELQASLAALGPDNTEGEEIAAELSQMDREIIGEYQRQSFLGSLGRAIEPVVKPLGWDWKIGCAVLASFPAREVVIATLGVIYNVGDDVESGGEEGATQLQAKLRNATRDDTGERLFNVPVALSVMVFFALCAQCAATLAVIKRETNSWRWPAFTFVYMTTLAYLGALITYQVGVWMGG